DGLPTSLAEHPSLQVLNAKKGKAKTRAKASRGLYHPNVFMYGSYHLYDHNGYAKDISPDWFVGLGMRVPLVDRAGRRHETAAADRAATEAALLQSATELNLTVMLVCKYCEVMQAII